MSPADTYTHGHHESVLRSHRWRTAANSAGYLVPHLRAGLSLLDIGCGPGTITVDLARMVAPGPAIGLDRDEKPLISARQLAADNDLHNVGFAVGDAYQLDFRDGSFDVVHAHQVLQHLTDPVAALTEMRRVCRSGGVVAARDADYAAMTWYPANDRLDRWLELYHQVARGNGAEPDAGRRLQSWARLAGFPQISCSASVWCYATPEERAWWAGTWAERITRSSLAEQALAHRLSDEQELAELAAGWRTWAAQEDGWFTVLNAEVLCTVD